MESKLGPLILSTGWGTETSFVTKWRILKMQLGFENKKFCFMYFVLIVENNELSFTSF